MKAINFPESNLVLMGPKELAATKGEVLENDPFPGKDIYDLHVFTDGENVVSCWQLDEADLEILKQNGGKIYFRSLSGRTQAPMELSVSSPFPEPKDQLVTYQMIDELAAARGWKPVDLEQYLMKFPSPQEAWKNFWALRAAI